MRPQLRQGGKGALLPDERSNRAVTFSICVKEGLTDTDDCEKYENSSLINQYVESSCNLAGIFSKPCIWNNRYPAVSSEYKIEVIKWIGVCHIKSLQRSSIIQLLRPMFKPPSFCFT